MSLAVKISDPITGKTLMNETMESIVMYGKRSKLKSPEQSGLGYLGGRFETVVDIGAHVTGVIAAANNYLTDILIDFIINDEECLTDMGRKLGMPGFIVKLKYLQKDTAVTEAITKNVDSITEKLIRVAMETGISESRMNKGEPKIKDKSLGNIFIDNLTEIMGIKETE